MDQHALPAAGQTRIVIVGHVDHGKSTLIGRLLHDTGSLPAGKVEELKAVSDKRGMPLEWSFVLDAFQAERDQAITIDTTQIWFKTKQRNYVIIDAPGHREFLKNMISGAAQADAAVLVVDAVEGLREQTRRHAYLLKLLGLSRVAVAINKMDACGFAAERFAEVVRDVENYLAGIGLAPLAMIPISARHGDNIAGRSAATPWYEGPTLLEALDGFEPAPPADDRPLRLPVQDVYRVGDTRIIVGRIEAGVLRVGDTLLFSPSNRTARVKSIERWGTAGPPAEARAGDAVGFTLDEPIFVERGHLASHVEPAPMLTNTFGATLFWLGDRPLTVGRSLKIKLNTHQATATVQSIVRVVDTQSLAGGAATEVRRNDVAEVVLRTADMVAVDDYAAHPATGRFVLVDLYDTVAGGVIATEGYADQRARFATVKSTNLTEVEHLLTPTVRARRNGHRGAVIWFTGLSGAGKSTLAMRVEQRLFALGFQVYVLDGDNVRRGLNADLGFEAKDRHENIRRIGEAAALFADAGLIAITAFISPYQSDRDRARAAAPDLFHEIHIRADLDTCEARDPKGLYRKARAGLIPEFTGISAPYEPPVNPQLVVDTAALSVEESVERIVAYIRERTALGEGKALG